MLAAEISGLLSVCEDRDWQQLHRATPELYIVTVVLARGPHMHGAHRKPQQVFSFCEHLCTLNSHGIKSSYIITCAWLEMVWTLMTVQKL